MKLERYLEANSISGRDFARRLGVSEGYLSRLAAGGRVPSMEMAGRIREATNGAVTADDFLPVREPQAAAE